MPYKDISDLPDRVKGHLPKKAQKIYLEAFNHAWKQYEDPKKRRMGGSQEEVACRVAWSAVKKSYYKNEEGKWVSYR
jgi:cation transport regulator